MGPAREVGDLTGTVSPVARPLTPNPCIIDETTGVIAPASDRHIAVRLMERVDYDDRRDVGTAAAQQACGGYRPFGLRVGGRGAGTGVGR
jgi:hypothetical protein